MSHIAIIMDGNGRWATARNHNRYYGHVRGSQVAKKIVEAAVENNISELTLFAFSTENWKRPKEEIDFLFKVLSKYIKTEKQKLISENIKFQCVGDLSKIASPIKDKILDLIEKTKDNTKMTLTLALNYGGRADIISATKALMSMAQKNEIDPAGLSEEIFSSALMTDGLSNPDLIIRTSGEKRISNFFLWQMAYSEILFTDKMWPDYTKDDFLEALKNLKSRSRRFGKTPQQMKEVNPS